VDRCGREKPPLSPQVRAKHLEAPVTNTSWGWPGDWGRPCEVGWSVAWQIGQGSGLRREVHVFFSLRKYPNLFIDRMRKMFLLII
jgi:hypothetical protein